MKAVILAAGKGERMLPLTKDKPKVMVKIGNKPILEYLVESLAKVGVKHIYMVVGYKKETIMSHFGNGSDYNVTIGYIYQKHQLGTAHALLQVKDAVLRHSPREKKDEFFLVISGDNIVRSAALEELLDCGKESILITRNSLSSKYGVASLKGHNVKEIIERPISKEEKLLINTGVYRFKSEIFQDIQLLVDKPFAISSEYRYDLTFLLSQIYGEKKKALRAVKTTLWMDAVTPWDLLHMNSSMLEQTTARTAGTIERGVDMRGPVLIGENTLIRAGSYIRGPVVIGKGCDIGPNATIFSSTAIGDNVCISTGSEIKHSIIMDDVTVGMGSRICNSVVAAGSRIGSHVSTDTYRHEVGEKKGCIIGSDTIIHSGAIIDSGVTIGNNCRVSGGKRVYRSLPDGSVVM